MAKKIKEDEASWSKTLYLKSKIQKKIILPFSLIQMYRIIFRLCILAI